MEFLKSIKRQSKMYSVAQTRACAALLEVDGNVTVDVVFAEDPKHLAGRCHRLVRVLYQ